MSSPRTAIRPQAAPEQIKASLEAVLASPAFSAKRRADLLRYLVERTAAGEARTISEYGIALDVFGKPVSYDPRIDSAVRVEMSRVRKGLLSYYADGGKSDPWRIEFPARGYVPAFVPALQPADHTGESRNQPAPKAELPAAPPRRLNRVRLALVPLIAAVAVFAGWKWETRPRLVGSVVVLPFANLTGDPANDYLADGLTESLTDKLATIPSLRVVARTSAFQFRGKAADIRRIGRSVNAEAVVEGSIRTAEGHLQVTVQLSRTADGYHVLSRVFDGSPLQLVQLERDISLPVIASLRPGYGVRTEYAPDPEARKLVLRARTLRGYGAKDKFNKSVELLNQAIQIDPNYAGGWAELAGAYAAASTNALVEPLAAARTAKAAADKAIALDPASAEALGAEGYVDAMVMLDWKHGEAELRDALRLMPQSAAVHQHLAIVMLAQGRFDEALAEARAAADLDPLTPSAASTIGYVYFLSRRYDAALAEWNKQFGLHPDAGGYRELIAMALTGKKDYKGALEQMEAVRPQNPLGADFGRGYILAASGRVKEARSLLARFAATHPELSFDLAVDYGLLGDRDEAFKWLDVAWEHRNLYLMKVHPFLDPLRSDPRYAAMLKRAGLS